jgi:ribonuclease P protein component
LNEGNTSGFGFPKSERLKRKKSIEELFKNGSSFVVYPLRIIFLKSASTYTSQVLFSVPKRKIRKAVKRNQVRRILREAYRLNRKSLLIDNLPADFRCSIAIIYISDKLLSFRELESKLKICLLRLSNEIKGN